MDVIEIETPHGPARAHLEEPDGANGLVVLGHGAGGGVGAPDLVRAELEARKLGFATALVEQPYVVAGRKAPPPAAKADEAWPTVLAFLNERLGDPVPLITGGRSFGARVACRTAAQTGATAVLCSRSPSIRRASPRSRARTSSTRLRFRYSSFRVRAIRSACPRAVRARR